MNKIIENQPNIISEEFFKNMEDINSTKSKSLELLTKAAENNCNKSTGKRFDRELKQFSTYLYLIGGCLLYETLYHNFKQSLPSISSIRKSLEKDFSKQDEMRFKELKIYLEKHKYPSKIWISEDATSITGKIQYESASNTISGLTLPIDPATGLPIQNAFLATSARAISDMMKNNSRSTSAYVILAQPLVANSAPFSVCVYGTDNKFNFTNVLKRWQTMTKAARENGIEIVGFSSDGDTRLLKAMRFETKIPCPNKFNRWFQIDPDIFKLLYIQDTVHIGTKMKTRLLNKKTKLIIENFTATSEHLHQLIEKVPKYKFTDSHLNYEPEASSRR